MRITAEHHAPLSVQMKVAVNEPGDVYEQEADRLANEIVQNPEPKIGGKKRVGRVRSYVQRRISDGSAGLTAAPATLVEVLRSPGQPLDPVTRAFMELGFGADFSQVRGHADAVASRSTEAVGAKAYTIGSNMVFRRGEYAPETTQGQRLLAYEPVHVLQQRAADNRNAGLAPIDSDKPGQQSLGERCPLENRRPTSSSLATI